MVEYQSGSRLLLHHSDSERNGEPERLPASAFVSAGCQSEHFVNISMTKSRPFPFLLPLGSWPTGSQLPTVCHSMPCCCGWICQCMPLNKGINSMWGIDAEDVSMVPVAGGVAGPVKSVLT
jgi:hypothetical protein